MQLVLLMLLIILPCAVLVVYQNLEQRGRDRDQARQEAVQLARLLAAQYEDTREDARNTLAVLATLSLPADPARCALATQALLQEFQQYVNIGFANASGDVICSGLGGAGVSVADRDFFRIAMSSNDFAESSYQIGRISGRPSVGYAYPIRDAGGSPKGVVMATVDLTWFSKGLASFDLPEGARVTLFDRGGVVLARYPDAESFAGRNFTGSPLLNGVSQAGAGTLETQGLDGKERLYAYTLVGDALAPSLLTVGFAASSVFGAADGTLLRNVLILGIVGALAISAAFLLGDWLLVRPLRAVVVASRHLASGDLAARSGLRASGGELGILSSSFDRMADILVKREVKNVEIASSLERKVAQLDALHGVFSKITESLHTEDVVRAALREAANLVDAEVVVLRLIKGGELEVTGFVARDPEIELDLKPIPMGEGLIGRVAETGEAIRVEQGAEELMMAGQGIIGAQSGLAVPVMFQGEMLGTLGCWSLSPSAFMAEEQRLLEMLASQIASAITAAASRDDSERLARIDSLTGLPNRLSLAEDERLLSLTARRQNQAVVMVDIDHFKRINDDLGHLAGDKVLRQVASVLSRVSRATDTVYRFGGEEFLLIGHARNLDEALALADRLRLSVQSEVHAGDGHAMPRVVTVSAGVALFTASSRTLSDVVEAADQALYEAKRSGRNRCVASGDGLEEASAA